MSNINITKVKYLRCKVSGEEFQLTVDKEGNINNWWLQAYGVSNRIFNEHYFAEWKEKSESGEWGEGPKPIEIVFKKKEETVKTVKTGSNQNLREAAIDSGVQIYKWPFNHLNCQGQGRCGTCVVKIAQQKGLNEPTVAEKKKLKNKLQEQHRLACQCVAQESVQIELLS